MAAPAKHRGCAEKYFGLERHRAVHSQICAGYHRIPPLFYPVWGKMLRRRSTWSNGYSRSLDYRTSSAFEINHVLCIPEASIGGLLPMALMTGTDRPIANLHLRGQTLCALFAKRRR
jgi:hypothetical protein